jgi:hypothetical protein
MGRNKMGSSIPFLFLPLRTFMQLRSLRNTSMTDANLPPLHMQTALYVLGPAVVNTHTKRIFSPSPSLIIWTLHGQVV